MNGDASISDTECVDVVAFGAHPDDAELGCGGTLARLGGAGHTFALVSLTRGELGTRGDPETRAQEARRAGQELGASEVIVLDSGDGGLRHGAAEEDAVIDVLRRLRPRLVLGPPPRDRHPDHRRGFELVRDACYFAGLAKRGRGEAWRPSLLLSYLLHDMLEPDLVVDVTAVWPRKLAALRAHRSQFWNDETDDAESEPATWVSSPDFWRAIEGRARAFGSTIGCSLGEAFLAHGPLAVDDLFSVIGPGR